MNPNYRSYRITALFLALLMVFYSIGISIDLHFCQGNFKTFSLLGKAKSCHEISSAPKGCQHHQKMVIQKAACEQQNMGCCENKTLEFQSDESIYLQSHSFDFHQEIRFLFVEAYTHFPQGKFEENDFSPFAQYKPPLIDKDIPIFVQSFLL